MRSPLATIRRSSLPAGRQSPRRGLRKWLWSTALVIAGHNPATHGAEIRLLESPVKLGARWDPSPILKPFAANATSAPDRIRTCDLRFRRPIRRLPGSGLCRAVSGRLALLMASFGIHRSTTPVTAFDPFSPFSEGRNRGGLGASVDSLRRPRYRRRDDSPRPRRGLPILVRSACDPLRPERDGSRSSGVLRAPMEVSRRATDPPSDWTPRHRCRGVRRQDPDSVLHQEDGAALAVCLTCD
jgi:hypothetical protein